MKEEAEAAVETAKGVLQDLVVVVSLVRTLTESFGSAGDLFRTLKRKSKADSHSSDDEKKGRRKLTRRRQDSSSESDHDRGRWRHSLSWKRGSKKEDYSDSDEELICTSSSKVLAEYDRGYQKLGEGFARGDLTTQIQLQAQIIQLQRTLLTIQQDYMLSTYLAPSSSHSHLLRLIQTTRSTRAASIQALHMQYQRMLPSISPSMPDAHRPVPGAYPTPPGNMPRHDSVTRQPRTRSRNRSRSNSPVKDDGEVRIQPFPSNSSRKDDGEIRIQPFPSNSSRKDDGEIRIQPFPSNSSRKDEGEIRIQPYPGNSPTKDHKKVTIQPYPTPPANPHTPPHPHSNKLFCVYARDLQHHSRLPLTDNYKEGGDNRCPYCRTHIATRPGKAWEIIASGCKGAKRRVFLIKNRFVIKCHREGTGFACVLCARFKESDTVCRDIELLMDHIWKEHTGEELEKDDDIFEIDE